MRFVHQLDLKLNNYNKDLNYNFNTNIKNNHIIQTIQH